MSTYAAVILILILLYTFYMGFNDGSNAIATTVATHAIKPRTAILMGSVTQFIVPVALFLLGEWIGSGENAVAVNIRDKMLDGRNFDGISEKQGFQFILAGMLGAMVWGATAFIMKMPNSTAHTLLGGIIGASIAAFGFSSVRWTQFVIVNILLMIVLAPVIGLTLSFLFMKIAKFFMQRAPRSANNVLIVVQRVNLVLLAGAFSHNNAQKSVGVFLLLSALGLTSYGGLTPVYVVILVGIALMLGMALGGLRIVSVLGRKIYRLRHGHSVVAQLTTSIVMVAGTALGLSLSSGQIMTSSVMGVGAAAGPVSRVRWKAALKIIVSWFVTLPIAATVGALVYLVIAAV